MKAAGRVVTNIGRPLALAAAAKMQVVCPVVCNICNICNGSNNQSTTTNDNSRSSSSSSRRSGRRK